MQLSIGGHKNHNDLMHMNGDSEPTPKRARLDINYSIGPAGAFQSLNGSHHHHHHQSTPQQQNNRRKMTLVNRIV